MGKLRDEEERQPLLNIPSIKSNQTQNQPKKRSFITNLIFLLTSVIAVYVVTYGFSEIGNQVKETSKSLNY
jgi:hypothetical protein